MVLDMTNNKRVDTELLERIMREVERRISSESESSRTTDNQYIRDPCCSADSESDLEGQGSRVPTERRSCETGQLSL